MQNGANGNSQHLPQPVALIRLADDSDIGLIHVGITANVVNQVNPLATDSGTEIKGKVVQLWLTMALGQPNPILPGGIDIIEVPFRMIGAAEAKGLIEAFEAMKAKRQASAPALIVPG